MIYEYFVERGLLTFPQTPNAVDALFSSGVTRFEAASDVGVAVADLMHLNGAEATLLIPPRPWSFSVEGGIHTATPRPVPIEVTPSALELATWASDSGPFVGHDPRDDPKLWDVTLLGSDASKLAWLLGSDSIERLAAEFVGIVRRLREMYREILPTTYRDMAFRNRTLRIVAGYDPGILPLRATVWRAKIAVLLNESNPTRVLSATYASLSEG